jgi:predicted acetyltransferase
MITAEEYMHNTFTKKNLFIERVHTIVPELYKINVRNEDGNTVGTAMYKIEKYSIELYTLLNLGYKTKDTLYKGIGKQIITIIAILAHSLKIPVISFTAVPNAIEDKARKLFQYYEQLGAKTITTFYNEESWMQSFELSVDTFLADAGISVI